MIVAFYVGKGNYFDALIRFNYRLQRRGKLNRTHTEVVMEHVEGNTFKCMSSSVRDKGVVIRNIDIKPEHWEFINIDYPINLCVKWYKKHLGCKYDYLGAFHNFTTLVKEVPSRFYCSESLMASISVHSAFLYDPERAYDYLRLNARFNACILPFKDLKNAIS